MTKVAALDRQGVEVEQLQLNMTKVAALDRQGVEVEQLQLGAGVLESE
jgi:hypothetical protein